MRSIVKTIGGSGLSINGVLMLALSLSGLDRGRITDYGIIHELKIFGGTFFEVIFFLGIIFIIIGVILTLSGILSGSLAEDYDY